MIAGFGPSGSPSTMLARPLAPRSRNMSGCASSPGTSTPCVPACRACSSSSLTAAPTSPACRRPSARRTHFPPMSWPRPATGRCKLRRPVGGGGDPRPHGPEPRRSRTSPSPGDPVPGEARWCEATVDGIRFASVYVPNGRTLDSPEFPRKLAFLDAIAARARCWPAVRLRDRRRHQHRPGRPRRLRPGRVHRRHPRQRRGAHAAGADTARRGLSSTPTATCTPTSRSSPGGTTGPGNFHKGLGLRIDLALLSPSARPAAAPAA